MIDRRTRAVLGWGSLALSALMFVVGAFGGDVQLMTMAILLGAGWYVFATRSGAGRTAEEIERERRIALPLGLLALATLAVTGVIGTPEPVRFLFVVLVSLFFLVMAVAAYPRDDA